MHVCDVGVGEAGSEWKGWGFAVRVGGEGRESDCATLDRCLQDGSDDQKEGKKR
jgi:hypothetical protein